MKWIKYILIFTCFNGVAQASNDEWQKRVDQFVESVNSGDDGALYAGKILLTELKKSNENYAFKMRVNLSLGNYYRARYQLPLALNYYQITKEIAVENKDTVYAAYANGSKAFVYNSSGQFEKALAVYLENLSLWKQRKNYPLIATAYGNVCKTYANLKNWDKVWDCCSEALQFIQLHAVTKDVEDVYYTAGLYYNSINRPKLDSAQYYTLKGVNFAIENQNIESVFKSKILLSRIEQANGLYAESIQACNDVYDTLQKMKIYPELSADACNCMAYGFSALGEDSLGMTYMEKHNEILNDLRTLRQSDNLATWELEHAFHASVVQDSVNNEIKRQKIAIEEQAAKEYHTLLYYAMIFGSIVLLFVLWYVSRYLKLQKSGFYKLAETNREITDSIIYAQRIQNAFIPTEDEVSAKFEEAFVFYQPKDIVAGDFYWLIEKNDSIFLAAADCTGHGVPGAMVSVVCHNALEEAINLSDKPSPANVLDKTNELVIKQFTKDGEAIKDGMDIALIKVKYNEINDNFCVDFAGAQNPLMIISDGKIEMIKGNKQPIGFHTGRVPFSNTSVELKKGSLLYLFSDGFVDQFGGEKGKKLKSKGFKDLILKNSHLPMNEQNALLKQFFEVWKADYEQLDDVCVIGVRL